MSGKSGCDELYRSVAESLGLHLVVQNCRELNLPAGNVGQIEGKIKQLVAQASTKSPSLLILENIEVFCLKIIFLTASKIFKLYIGPWARSRK